MALWIGPLSLHNRIVDRQASTLIAKKFGEISTRGGSAFLELLKGVNLPAVSALDYACPCKQDWEKIYQNPNLPLVVDIGCGNGLFVLRMARAPTVPLNFLGLEVRKKLVDRCLQFVEDCKLSNVHFIEADAATMFKRIISNYPGEVFMVAIQCPVPNFINIETRRRMVQNQLVEQIIDSVSEGGKIFLQSDVKSVALQLKTAFLECGGDRVVMSSEHEDPSKCDAEGWLLCNPFGHSTDWEDHVRERGDPMFRVLLSRL